MTNMDDDELSRCAGCGTVFRTGETHVCTNAPRSTTNAADTNRAEPMKAKHDYPACAIFRGGKCTCDEADKLCPKCGTEEWDHVTAERGRERDVPFNYCPNCDHEWEPK